MTQKCKVNIKLALLVLPFYQYKQIKLKEKNTEKKIQPFILRFNYTSKAKSILSFLRNKIAIFSKGLFFGNLYQVSNIFLDKTPKEVF